MAERVQRPTGYVLWGVWYDAKTWKELAVGVASQLYFHHAKDFGKLTELRGKTRQYFAETDEGMKEPKAVGNSGYWIETNRSGPELVAFSRQMLRMFGYYDADLRVMVETQHPKDPRRTVLA